MEKIFRVINKALMGIVSTIFALIVVLVIIQVFCRYILNSPVVWINEFVQLILIWGTLLGCGLAIRLDKHIQIDLLLQKIPLKAAVVLQLTVLGLLIFLSGFYLIKGSQIAWSARGTLLTSLQWSKLLYFGAIPVSAVVWLINLFEKVFEIVKGLKPGEVRVQK